MKDGDTPGMVKTTTWWGEEREAECRACGGSGHERPRKKIGDLVVADTATMRDLDDVATLILSERERHTSPLEWLDYPHLFVEYLRFGCAFIAGEEDRREKDAGR